MSKLQRKTLTPEEIEDLSKDLTHQVSIHDNLAAIKTIKNPELRREIEKILTAPKLPDMVAGAGLGTVLGGASGALLVGLGKGLSSAHYGLANAIPGAISGAIIGGQYGRQRRIQDLLQRKGGAMQKKGMLKEAVPRWRREGDEPFRYFLTALKDDAFRYNSSLTPEEMRQAIKELSDARGNKPLSFDEQRLLKWQYPKLMRNPDPDKAKLHAEFMKQEAKRRGISRGFSNFVKRENKIRRGLADRNVFIRPPELPESPHVPEPLRKHLGNVLKSTPIKVLGALAALSALGYGTAKALESKTILDKRD